MISSWYFLLWGESWEFFDLHIIEKLMIGDFGSCYPLIIVIKVEDWCDEIFECWADFDIIRESLVAFLRLLRSLSNIDAFKWTEPKFH